MKKIQHIQSWLLIILLALSVHGVADAKLAPASISFSSVTHHGIDHIEQQKYHYDAAVNIQYCCSEYADKALQEIFQDRFVVAFTRYGNATNSGAKMRKDTGHIFDKKKVNDGHIAPTTEASKKRASKMFENVTADPANKRPDLVTSPHKQNAGIEVFTKNQNNGQIWVETRKGTIQNAGVNRKGDFK